MARNFKLLFATCTLAACQVESVNYETQETLRTKQGPVKITELPRLVSAETETAVVDIRAGAYEVSIAQCGTASHSMGRFTSHYERCNYRITNNQHGWELTAESAGDFRDGPQRREPHYCLTLSIYHEFVVFRNGAFNRQYRGSEGTCEQNPELMRFVVTQIRNIRN